MRTQIGLESIGYKKFKGKGLFNKSVFANCPIFEFELHTKLGEVIEINAYGTDDLVEYVNMAQFKEKSKKEIDFSIQGVTPQILIGSDFYGKY